MIVAAEVIIEVLHAERAASALAAVIGAGRQADIAGDLASVGELPVMAAGASVGTGVLVWQRCNHLRCYIGPP